MPAPGHRGDRLGREVAVSPPLHAELSEAFQPLREQDPLEFGDAAQTHLVEVLVGVDVARRHEQPRCVQHLLAGRRVEVSDLGDSPLGDAHVDVLQLPVVGVERQQMGDVAQEEAGHGRQSAKLGAPMGRRLWHKGHEVGTRCGRDRPEAVLGSCRLSS